MIDDLVQTARNIRAGYVLAREGALGLVDASSLPSGARLFIRLARLLERRRARDGAARLSAALTRLGPSYVKFGQFLATRPDIVGAVVAYDLQRLQDRMPPFPKEEAARIVESALGRPMNAVFIGFGEAVAAASIAQVHKAQLIDDEGGSPVAIKIVRPGIRERFARDLQAMRAAARLLERVMPDAKRLRAQEVVETIARSVTMEMDLRLEAAAISELDANTKDDEDFRVPKPIWDLTARDVLTLEWVDGIRLNDLAAIDARGQDRTLIARRVVQSFLRHAIRDGFFHADMHPGNLFVDDLGRLVAVDFGIMGRLGLKERRFLAEILLGFISRDYRRVAEVHFEAGYVPGHHSIEDFAQAIRAIGEPIHDRRADEISMAKLLGLLFEITALFDMETRTELVMLQKTMVVVEGVARSLDPKLDIWSTSEPVVRTWIERHMGPLGRIEQGGRAVQDLIQVAKDIPDLSFLAKRVMQRLDTEFEDRAKIRMRKPGFWRDSTVLWIIAIALVVIALELA